MYLKDLVLHFNHAGSYVLMIHCSFLSHFLSSYFLCAPFTQSVTITSQKIILTLLTALQ